MQFGIESHDFALPWCTIPIGMRIAAIFDHVYGNIVQDAISLFDGMAMNFKDMYLKFE